MSRKGTLVQIQGHIEREHETTVLGTTTLILQGHRIVKIVNDNVWLVQIFSLNLATLILHLQRTRFVFYLPQSNLSALMIFSIIYRFFL